jgi:hypothetical protein
VRIGGISWQGRGPWSFICRPTMDLRHFGVLCCWVRHRNRPGWWCSAGPLPLVGVWLVRRSGLERNRETYSKCRLQLFQKQFR